MFVTSLTPSFQLPGSSLVRPRVPAAVPHHAKPMTTRRIPFLPGIFSSPALAASSHFHHDVAKLSPMDWSCHLRLPLIHKPNSSGRLSFVIKRRTYWINDQVSESYVNVTSRTLPLERHDDVRTSKAPLHTSPTQPPNSSRCGGNCTLPQTTTSEEEDL
jgi:hypothetical protein